MTWWRWASDLRYAVRTLARRPGLSLVAAGSLALVIGTATAQLSYLDFLLWAKLPVPHPEGLVWINVRTPQPGWAETSYPDYLDYRDGAAVLSGLAAWAPFGTTVQIGADTTHVWGHLVSGNFFSVLGAGMARGRPLGVEDDRAGAERVAVLSDGFWRRACHGDPAILGRGLLLNGVSFTVVGIAPERFRGSARPGGVLTQVLRRALALAAAGSLLGLAAAAAVLLAVTLLATLQPARRAARVDPVRAISGPLS